MRPEDGGDSMVFGAEMVELSPATGFGVVVMIVQALLGLLFVVVPLGILIYVAVLLRRLTAAVQRIEHLLAPSPDTGESPPTS